MKKSEILREAACLLKRNLPAGMFPSYNSYERWMCHAVSKIIDPDAGPGQAAPRWFESLLTKHGVSLGGALWYYLHPGDVDARPRFDVAHFPATTQQEIRFMFLLFLAMDLEDQEIHPREEMIPPVTLRNENS